MADVVASTNLSQRFASLPPRYGFEDLVAAELELPAKPYPSGLGSFAPFVGSGADEFSLEFSQAARHHKHQSAMRGCRIAPVIGK